MNYLQRYIDARGLSCQDIATATGHGYHSIQKTVKGVRQSIPIRQAIANFLGLDNEKTWHKGSVLYLRKMLAQEVNRLADEKADTARQQILKKYSDSPTLTGKGHAVNG